MKILMLGWELPPHNSGGLGVACYHMAKALSSHGAIIDFVVPYDASAHEDITFMKVISGAPKKQATKMISAYATHTGEIQKIQSTYETYALAHVKQNNYDVVHAHDWLTLGAGMKIKKTYNLPLVAHVHATEFDRAGGGSGHPLIHDIEYNGLLMADRIIAVSEWTKQLIVRKYDIPADKIEVVHNSIDMTEFTEPALGNTYEYLTQMKMEGYLIVSTVGRLTIQKGLTHFLKAAAKASSRIDKFIYVIGGDGELRNPLLEQAAELGIADQVIFTGFIRGAAWRDLYQQSDVFVMSSVSEPFGLTALEAAAHDSALILTYQSGVSEVLSHSLKYDFWDEDKLADQLVNLAASTSLAATLRHNVFNEVSNLSWSTIAQNCFNQYHYAIKRSSV